jgi:hypothetical protein
MEKKRILIVFMVYCSFIYFNLFSASDQSDENGNITFNFEYNVSSIEKIFTSPEKVIEDVPAFWKNEDA